MPSSSAPMPTARRLCARRAGGAAGAAGRGARGGGPAPAPRRPVPGRAPAAGAARSRPRGRPGGTAGPRPRDGRHAHAPCQRDGHGHPQPRPRPGPSGGGDGHRDDDADRGQRAQRGPVGGVRWPRSPPAPATLPPVALVVVRRPGGRSPLARCRRWRWPTRSPCGGRAARAAAGRLGLAVDHGAVQRRAELVARGRLRGVSSRMSLAVGVDGRVVAAGQRAGVRDRDVARDLAGLHQPALDQVLRQRGVAERCDLSLAAAQEEVDPGAERRALRGR